MGRRTFGDFDPPPRNLAITKRLPSTNAEARRARSDRRWRLLPDDPLARPRTVEPAPQQNPNV
jgi:hypothetical protein